MNLIQAMGTCRALTLDLFAGIDAATFCQQVHPDFSPVGWHLGHIAYTEALWLLEKAADQPPLFPEYRRIFAQDGLPKGDRIHLPDVATVQHYLATVRQQVWEIWEPLLAAAPVPDQSEAAVPPAHRRLWQFLLQHESQHCETVAIVLALQGAQPQRHPGQHLQPLPAVPAPMLHIPAGPFTCGSDQDTALDNERPAHVVDLAEYWIDAYPVTCAQYQQFIWADGYQNPEWWTPTGWDWLQKVQATAPITQPHYWSEAALWGALGSRNQPVCGVSGYEAAAYARFVDKQLPTEWEWEKAARQLQGVGRVWEWTRSPFQGYAGFAPYPYPGYSQTYFDGQHWVLRGSSWVTRPWSRRTSFRNWYHPDVRGIFAGFRCATWINPAARPDLDSAPAAAA